MGDQWPFWILLLCAGMTILLARSLFEDSQNAAKRGQTLRVKFKSELRFHRDDAQTQRLLNRIVCTLVVMALIYLQLFLRK